MIINLLQSYPSIHKLPLISKVDTRIFTERYFTYCLKCNFCNDSCCYFSTDVDLENLERINQWAEDLESYSGINKSDWFQEGYKPYPEYPGKAFVRVNRIKGACAFLSRQKRGCLIHSFCIERGIDYHHLKPMLCSIFPLTFDEGLLHPAVEVDEKNLCCLGNGETLYYGVRHELAYYFGVELVDELDKLKKS